MPRNPDPRRGIEPRDSDDDDDTQAAAADLDAVAPDPPAIEEDLGEPEVAEAVGPTLEEAIENALEILGAREDEVDVEILQQGRRRILGMGASRPFRVRVTWREDLDEEVIEEEVSEEESAERSGYAGQQTAPPPGSPRPAERPPSDPLAALSDRAREVTEDLLRRMGIEAIVRSEPSEGEVRVDIESDEDDSLLIGHRGETRAALQHIIQRLVTPRDERGTPVLVDVNGYWVRRVERLHQDALELARLALERGDEVRTEPLSAQERRIVHRALADDARVATESVGEGALKRVAILPAKGTS